MFSKGIGRTSKKGKKAVPGSGQFLVKRTAGRLISPLNQKF